MSSETSDKLGFARLGEQNYGRWSGDMTGKLMEKRCWRVVSGESKRPTDPLEVEEWTITCNAASGLIWSGLDSSMKEMVKGLLGNPKQMWDTLQAHHQQKKPTTRFVAYEALLGIQKAESESLTSLCMRVTAAQGAMKDT